MTATLVADRLADPAELEETSVLATRIIPNPEPNKPPSVAELVRLDVSREVAHRPGRHLEALGRPRLADDGHRLHGRP